MSLVLGKNPSNELTPMEVDNSGNLKVNLAGSSHTGSINVDITGNSIGLATSALQTTGNTSLGNIDTNLTAINSSNSNIETSTSNIDSSTTIIDTSTQSIAADTLTIGAVSGSEMQCDIVSSAIRS
jgi:hypothetical protein